MPRRVKSADLFLHFNTGKRSIFTISKCAVGGDAMTVRAILENKGREVFTVSAETSIESAIGILGAKRIGAIVVVNDLGQIKGILSERDVVRQLSKFGASCLDKPISTAMTAKVQTCREDETIETVMARMTTGRFRHLPVEKNGKLIGIISIGDVVKKRIEDVQREAEDIRTYIAMA
jgi:CBS domain-containing protein